MIFVKFLGPSTQSRVGAQESFCPVRSLDSAMDEKAFFQTSCSAGRGSSRSPRKTLSRHSFVRASILLNRSALSTPRNGGNAGCRTASSFHRRTIISGIVSSPARACASGDMESFRESFRELGAPGSPRLAPRAPRTERRSPRRGAPGSPRPKRSGSSSRYWRDPRSFCGLGRFSTSGNLSTGIT